MEKRTEKTYEWAGAWVCVLRDDLVLLAEKCRVSNNQMGYIKGGGEYLVVTKGWVDEEVGLIFFVVMWLRLLWIRGTLMVGQGEYLKQTFVDSP